MASSAAELVNSYEFADPAILRAVYRYPDDLVGRNMLLVGRFLVLRFAMGVRITEAHDEVRDGEHRIGWSYQTLEGHLEQGKLTYEIAKDLASGAVEFRIHAYSRRSRIRNPARRARLPAVRAAHPGALLRERAGAHGPHDAGAPRAPAAARRRPRPGARRPTAVRRRPGDDPLPAPRPVTRSRLRLGEDDHGVRLDRPERERLLQVQLHVLGVVGGVADRPVLADRQHEVAAALAEQQRAVEARRPDDLAAEHPREVVHEQVAAVLGGLHDRACSARG